jgi:hypothetical protein
VLFNNLNPGPFEPIRSHASQPLLNRCIERKQISAEPMSAEEWKRQFVREG